LPPDCQSATVVFTAAASVSGSEDFQTAHAFCPFCCVLFSTHAEEFVEGIGK